MRPLLYIIATVCLLLTSACVHHSESWTTLDRADAVMEEHPDSALALLQGIDRSTFNGDDEKARYALLLSQALDKNYIDTTSFDILQPAIDYYTKHGSPDEKLRTYYYQARIYQNIGDDDSAMGSFLKALDLGNMATDTLSLARALGAQAVIYFKEYKLNEYIQNNIDAAKLYHELDKIAHELSSYKNALYGYIMLSDKPAADSLLAVCISLNQKIGNDDYDMFSSLLSYVNEFGSPEDIRLFLGRYPISDVSGDDALNIADGYLKIGDPEKALNIITDMEWTGSVLDSLKYYAIKIDILRKQGEYEQAYDLYNEYTVILEEYQKNLFSNDLLFAEKKHRLEMENLMRLQYRDRIILAIAAGSLILLLISAILYYKYRLSQSNHAIAEKEREKAEIERDKKALEAENLDKENRRLEAEQNQRELEAENLRLEINQLEIERDSLKEFLNRKPLLDQQLRQVVKLRIDMLNGLLASELTNNEKHAVPYRKWLESVRVKNDEFINSTRLVFTALYPKFIEYLECRGLTVDEINCICLYTIGLIGKEIGEYTRQKRHYAMSSEIRKKLGMNSHETNIGIFVKNKLKEIEGE